VCLAERDYDMQFWKEELVREINELEKSAAELEVGSTQTLYILLVHSLIVI